MVISMSDSGPIFRLKLSVFARTCAVYKLNHTDTLLEQRDVFVCLVALTYIAGLFVQKFHFRMLHCDMS
jgi:hypothetical protein